VPSDGLDYGLSFLLITDWDEARLE